MEQPYAFLESQFDRALAIGNHGAAAAHAATAGNVSPPADLTRHDNMPHERDSQFRRLLDALPAAVYTTDAAGRITYYNEAAAELWGRRPTPGADSWCGSWKLFRPDGTAMAHDECPMAIALRQGRAVRGVEAGCERPDGTRIPFRAYPTPLFDERGELTGAVNMLVDIAEAKRAEEQRQVMTRELHHRVKNTLATVQAIVGLTARLSETTDELREALIGRIGALAKTHVLLTDERSVATFGDIVHGELGAYDDGTENRIRLGGPAVELPPQIAILLGLAVHELSTNAMKYGALSVRGGAVDVVWSEAADGARRRLDFDWIESGGPQVTEPKRQGFGWRMLNLVLPIQIQAKTSIEYRADGLRVRCSVPLAAAEQ